MQLPIADPRFELTPEQVYAVAVGWRQLLRDNGLELIASEAKVVNDELRLAGSLDRLALTTRPIHFGRVTVPAEIVVVLDIKSSTWSPDDDGLPNWWDGYPIQIEAYRGAVPYDVETDERGTWDQAPSDEHALIAHIDVPQLHEGRAVWTLLWVDLDAGRRGIAAVQAARHYHAETKFATSAESTIVEVVDPFDPELRDELRVRKAAMQASANDTGWGDEFALVWRASGVTGESTNAEIKAALDRIEPPFDPAPHDPVVVDHRETCNSPVDDGGLLDPAALDVLLTSVAKLEHRATLNRWVAEARADGVDWHPRVQRTVRSFEIARAALALAVASDGADEFAEAIIDRAVPRSNGQIGLLLGQLTIAEAQQVHDVAQRVGVDLVYVVDRDGVLIQQQESETA